MKILFSILFVILTSAFAFAASLPLGSNQCDPDGSYQCWNRCPWVFDECAKTCGGGSACWHKCPWVFDECAQICGHKGAPDQLTFQRYQLQTKEILHK